jgi:hypothetical protein
MAFIGMGPRLSGWRVRRPAALPHLTASFAAESQKVDCHHLILYHGDTLHAALNQQPRDSGIPCESAHRASGILQRIDLRLHRGYSFGATPLCAPVQERSLKFKNHFRAVSLNCFELSKTAVNRSAIFKQLFCVVPKPGVRGSSPLRDAILHTTFDVQTCIGMNSHATGRRRGGPERGGTRQRWGAVAPGLQTRCVGPSIHPFECLAIFTAKWR